MKKSLWFGLVALFALVGSGSFTRASAQTPLVNKYGVGTLIHPLRAKPSPGAPHQCLNSVHVFGVNGFDPLCLGNFNGLCSHLKDQGCSTHFAQLWSVTDMAGQIRTIRASDPNAKVVLMGYSLGANRVRALANELGREGVQIDLLVYLGGDMVRDPDKSSPANVSNVLNVRAHGLLITGGDLLNGADLPAARNVRLNTRHMKIPSRNETVDLVMGELFALTAQPASPAVPAQSGTALK